MESKINQTSRTIAKNTLYGFSTWIVPLFLSFIATPIIVESLGHEDFGIYALVLGFIAYSFTFSIGRAVTKYVAEYKTTGEIEKIRGVISATFFINLTVGVLGVAIICLLANWLVADVFHIKAERREKAIFSFYIASLTIFFLSLNQVFSAVLQGIHRFDVHSKIYNLFSILQLLGNIVLAVCGFGLISLLAWNLVMTAAMCFGFLISAKKLLPEFGIVLNVRIETIKLVLSFSAGIIGYQIMANILLLFERGWITRKLGAESLTFYVVPFTLALYILSFIISLLLVILPLTSELKDNREKLLSLYTKATKTVVFFVVFIALTLIVESEIFLTLWMGKEFAENSSNLLILHTLSFAITAVSSVSWQITDGLGYPRYNAFVFSICLVVSVSLMSLLTENYGNFGVAIGRLIGYGAIFFSVFYVERWFFGRIQINFWARLTGKIAAPAVLAVLVEKLIISNFPVSWEIFFLSVFAGGVCYCLGLLFLGFISDEEKQIVKNIFFK